MRHFRHFRPLSVLTLCVMMGLMFALHITPAAHATFLAEGSAMRGGPVPSGHLWVSVSVTTPLAYGASTMIYADSGCTQSFGATYVSTLKNTGSFVHFDFNASFIAGNGSALYIKEATNTACIGPLPIYTAPAQPSGTPASAVTSATFAVKNWFFDDTIKKTVVVTPATCTGGSYTWEFDDNPTNYGDDVTVNNLWGHWQLNGCSSIPTFIYDGYVTFGISTSLDLHTHEFNATEAQSDGEDDGVVISNNWNTGTNAASFVQRYTQRISCASGCANYTATFTDVSPTHEGGVFYALFRPAPGSASSAFTAWSGPQYTALSKLNGARGQNSRMGARLEGYPVTRLSNSTQTVVQAGRTINYTTGFNQYAAKPVLDASGHETTVIQRYLLDPADTYNVAITKDAGGNLVSPVLTVRISLPDKPNGTHHLEWRVAQSNHLIGQDAFGYTTTGGVQTSVDGLPNDPFMPVKNYLNFTSSMADATGRGLLSAFPTSSVCLRDKQPSGVVYTEPALGDTAGIYSLDWNESDLTTPAPAGGDLCPVVFTMQLNPTFVPNGAVIPILFRETDGGVPATNWAQFNLVVTNANPVAAKIGAVSSTQITHQLLQVNFSTTEERGTLGFNIIGLSPSGQRIQLNTRLIRARGHGVGETRYGVVVRTVLPRTSFYIEEVTVQGRRTRYGPYGVGQTYG